MPHTPWDTDTAELAALVGAGRVLVLTGAGISTDSGIPDYRDLHGRMRHTAPTTLQRFTSSVGERRRYWARSQFGWPRIAAARPNAGHVAVARLQGAGLLAGVVTQNVDGLHTGAGTHDVIDLHGRLDAVVCLDCGSRRSRLEVGLRLDAVNPGFRREVTDGDADRPDGDVALDDAAMAGFRLVDCRGCGGVLKPDVVFFGEPVPATRFRAALAQLDAAAALLVLGSSLMVGSGYRFVTAAVRRGLPVAVVARGRTRGDAHATVRSHHGLAEVLGSLCTRLLDADPPAVEGPSRPTATGRAAVGPADGPTERSDVAAT